MPRLAELRLMAKIAHLYYEMDVKQAQIAKQLHISQATVSRLLRRAQDEQIVRISINIPTGVYATLEDELEARYGLKQAVIVDCMQCDDDTLQNKLGAAGAYYLETTIDKNEVVGISSWSATLLAMVDALSPLPRPIGAKVVQILGGVGNPAAEVHATRLTDRLAKLLSGEAHFLPAPGIVASNSTKTALLQDAYVNSSLALFPQVTLALVGIGSLAPSKLLATSGNSFSSEELDLLQQHQAVGDVCLRFFDSTGQQIKTALDERVIGMEPQQLREVDRVVGIAGGARKWAAIRGALVGKWINVLITDQATAAHLLDKTEIGI